MSIHNDNLLRAKLEAEDTFIPDLRRIAVALERIATHLEHPPIATHLEFDPPPDGSLNR